MEWGRGTRSRCLRGGNWSGWCASASCPHQGRIGIRPEPLRTSSERALEHLREARWPIGYTHAMINAWDDEDRDTLLRERRCPCGHIRVLERLLAEDIGLRDRQPQESFAQGRRGGRDQAHSG